MNHHKEQGIIFQYRHSINLYNPMHKLAQNIIGGGGGEERNRQRASQRKDQYQVGERRRILIEGYETSY